MAELKQIPEGLEYSYTEPTTNSDGSPLVDLDHTSIYVDVGAGPVKTLDVPATSPNGGGNIVQIIQNPFEEGKEGTVSVHATAVDDNNQESEIGAQATVEVDFLAPAPPQ